MNGNKLLLNSDKTHFIIISAKKNTNQVILLNTGSEIMEPSDSERLLGLQVSGHLTWNEHICNGDKSLAKALSVRINGLWKVCVRADIKTRKMLAIEIVHSKLVYMIQLYGQASDYFIKMLQVQQNRAARTVTRLEWNTRTKVLLQQVGWLSVRQLFAYHSLCLVRKIEFSGQPLFLKEKLKRTFAYDTRQATSNCYSISHTPKSERTRKSFVHSSIVLWNSLPSELRILQAEGTFKMNLKLWIRDNVESFVAAKTLFRC